MDGGNHIAGVWAGRGTVKVQVGGKLCHNNVLWLWWWWWWWGDGGRAGGEGGGGSPKCVVTVAVVVGEGAAHQDGVGLHVQCDLGELLLKSSGHPASFALRVFKVDRPVVIDDEPLEAGRAERNTVPERADHLRGVLAARVGPTDLRKEGFGEEKQTKVCGRFGSDCH